MGPPRPSRTERKPKNTQLIEARHTLRGGDVSTQRRLVAELCRLIGSQYNPDGYHGPGADLPPRLRQALARLLAGDSEKQIARHLELSPHTVHVYVKRLYRHYDVCSRGELLARFVRNPFAK